MKFQRIYGCVSRVVCAAAALAGGVVLNGCGMPGAPQPPSLNLPNKVTNLAAIRMGNEIWLNWSMPKRTTDKQILKENISVRICRREPAIMTCETAGEPAFAPGADGTFTETLPPSLAAGVARPLIYDVDALSRKGRSAGEVSVTTLAGQAPPAIMGLGAEVRKDGVLLHWSPAPSGAPPASIRLVRTLLTAPPRKSGQGPIASPAEPTERDLLVEPGSPGDHALDSDIHFGESYEYRAQRVSHVTVTGHSLELAGPLTPAVRIDALNEFPPAVPQGLAAVATAGENGNPPGIDLNWMPVTDADLAGYIVYRSESGEPGGATSDWKRISPAQPDVRPGFHDSNVQTGHSYMYAVSAVGQNGYESSRSSPAGETVPSP